CRRCGRSYARSRCGGCWRACGGGRRGGYRRRCGCRRARGGSRRCGGGAARRCRAARALLGCAVQRDAGSALAVVGVTELGLGEQDLYGGRAVEKGNAGARLVRAAVIEVEEEGGLARIAGEDLR